MPSLEFEERPLALEPAGVAHEGAVLADDPVAGDDDRERVLPDRLADVAGQGAIPVAPGQFAVGRCGAEWNLPEERPDPSLKVVAVGRDGHIKRRSLAG